MSKDAEWAVFVDVDNLSVMALEVMLSRWKYRQTPLSLRRAYGNLERIKGASTVLQRHGFAARVNLGKGTTDMLLAVEVMDALHKGSLPATVALASSDSDFIPLAWRLREAGLRVVGVAEKAKANVDVLASAFSEMEWCDPVPTPVAEVAAVTSIPAVTLREPAQAHPAPHDKGEPATGSVRVDAPVAIHKAKAIVDALAPWLPDTVKQLNQAGSTLRQKKIVSGSKPLHEHFREFPDVFKVLPSTGPARSVRLLRRP